jgi:hypothetical protein
VQISELRPPEGRHKAKSLISDKSCHEKTDLEGRRKAKPRNSSKLMGKNWPPKGQKKAKLNNLRKSQEGETSRWKAFRWEPMAPNQTEQVLEI